jgi:hypothetical protein
VKDKDAVTCCGSNIDLDKQEIRGKDVHVQEGPKLHVSRHWIMKDGSGTEQEVTDQHQHQQVNPKKGIEHAPPCDHYQRLWRTTF